MTVSKEEKISMILKDPDTPQCVLQAYYASGDSFTRRRLAQNKNLPQKLLQKMSRDNDFIVRGYIAENPGCGSEILELLTSDSNEYVKITAKNKLTEKEQTGT